MTVDDWIKILGVAVALMTGTGGVTWYFTERRRGRIDRDKAEAEEIRARTAQTVAEFGANIELNKYIDTRTDERVEAQLKPLRDEITRLQESLAASGARTLAMTRILRAIANQWPANHPGPKLDPADIAAVEDNIPSLFLKGHPSS